MLAVLFSRCQENNAVIEPDQSLDGPLAVKIRRAEQRFENAVREAGEINKENPRGYLKKTPQWEQAYAVELSIGQGLVVPVYYDDPVYLTSDITGQSKLAANAVTHLLVYTGEDHQLHYELLSSFPSNHAGDRFTGIIVVEDWNGHSLAQYRYQPDGTIQALRSIDESRQPATGGYIASIVVCYSYVGWNYSALDPGGYYYEIDMGCGSYTIDVGGFTYPSGGDYGSAGGGGGDAGGGSSPCDGRIAGREPSPCDPPTPPGEAGPDRPLSIKNNVDNPCIYLQVERLTKASAFIRFMFGTNEYLSIEYVMGDLGGTRDATTTEYKNGAYYTVMTTINRQRLGNSTNEYVMATLIHEMYHAYNTTTNHGWSTEETDHIYMTENRDEMAGILRVFFPNMDEQTSKDLMWGGLGETPAFQALPDAEKQRIKNVNTDYQYGALGTICR